MVKNCRMCDRVLRCCRDGEDLDVVIRQEESSCFLPSKTYKQTKKVVDLANQQIDDRDERMKKMFLNGIKVVELCRTCTNVRTTDGEVLICRLGNERTGLNSTCEKWELDDRVVEEKEKREGCKKTMLI